jgi:hypothetical protein
MVGVRASRLAAASGRTAGGGGACDPSAAGPADEEQAVTPASAIPKTAASGAEVELIHRSCGARAPVPLAEIARCALMQTDTAKSLPPEPL